MFVTNFLRILDIHPSVFTRVASFSLEGIRRSRLGMLGLFDWSKL